MKYYFVLFVLLVLLSACRKDSIDRSCTNLQQELSASNKNKVEIEVNRIIQSLPSQDYTQENFEKLVNLIAGKCNIVVTGKCFDCIQTLPSQSEIYISLDSVRMINKVVDISYTTDNRMKFHNLHD